jgi:hypothetical protein
MDTRVLSQLRARTGAPVKITCEVLFDDGTRIDSESEIPLRGDIEDPASELHESALQLARELLDMFPESIAILFGSQTNRSALIVPRPDSAAAREFISSLQDEAVKKGVRIGSGKLDS